MSGAQANEFTPLLPAEEHGPHEQSQSSNADDSGHLRPDQNGPGRHRQSSGRGSRQLAAAVILSRGNRGSVDEAISSAIDDGYDGEQLMRARSRLNSYPVLPEPEGIKKKDEETVHTIEQVGSQDEAEAGETDPENDPNSKYMRVGPLRFWLVFTTVLLGMYKFIYGENGSRLRRCEQAILWHASTSHSWHQVIPSSHRTSKPPTKPHG